MSHPKMMTKKKSLIAAALFAAANMAFAQAASAPAIAPSKLVLINKLVQLQQPGVEAVSRQLVQQPLQQLMQGAGNAIQQQPADKREALAKSIEGEIRKFADDAVGVAKDKGAKLSGPTWAPMIDERFSEDELKQILAWLESPVSKKYQQAGMEMMQALAPKMAADARPVLEPKFKALDQSIAKQLGITPRPPAGAASAAAPAPKAPAKK